ncbi:MAG: molybdopterin-synthase adenylyltransferase MoeB [Deltaproteobacteria bacterium]|nr:molybdopterin-synthase adenylyltransferase MoeB [Deltaproteobacteria bacterium]MBW2723190.1 molybdopterin-synthase adenylyltransferase MoeB [Deltaproteobacteria bacterium]
MSKPELAPPLRPDQFDRYRRHLSLPEMGLEGQQKLLESKVLLIGAGGLGCPLALYLAAAGVGRLGLVDDDVVDASNLQRQVLYQTQDIGRFKVEVAKERIRGLNPDVEVEVFRERLTSENALGIFEDYDVIVDGTDNFPTRYLSNDACVLLGKPNVYGSIFRFEGQASVFDARTGPCYRCLFPEPPPPGAVPSCAEGGVLGVLPAMIATIQATETIKLLVGKGTSLSGRLLLYDALAMEFNEFQLKKDPDCPVCGESPTIKELIDYQGFCGLPELAETPEVRDVGAAAVAASFSAGEDFLLLDVRNDDEFARARIEGSKLIPLDQLEARVDELVAWRSSRIVVLCHVGGRSRKACLLLMEHGFERVENLEGGIDAWALTVDASIARYS